MADLYGVTTDFLLGRSDTQRTDSKKPIPLQGWYKVKDRFVENEYGNRFYLDTYGSKWLAFHSEALT